MIGTREWLLFSEDLKTRNTCLERIRAHGGRTLMCFSPRLDVVVLIKGLEPDAVKLPRGSVLTATEVDPGRLPFVLSDGEKRALAGLKVRQSPLFRKVKQHRTEDPTDIDDPRLSGSCLDQE